MSTIHLATYLDFLCACEQTLGRGYHLVAEGHAADAEVYWMTARFARQCNDHATALACYGPASDAPEALHALGPAAARTGPGQAA